MCIRHKAGDLPRRVVAGFTLIELVVVVVILGVLATLGIGSYRQSRQTHQLDAAARRVQADLMLVRQRAIGLGSEVYVEFTAGSGQYTAPGVPDIDRPGQDYAVNLAHSPYEATIGSAPSDQNGASRITFDAFGRVAYVNAGDPDPEIVITAGGRTRIVQVNPISGMAQILDAD